MAGENKSILTPFWYTPECDKDQEKPRKFQLRGLKGIEMMDLNVEARVVGNEARYPASAMMLAFTKALLDWENVTDPSGQQIKFDKASMRHNVDLLDFETITELFREILNASHFRETARKN